ncbi:MAG: class I SAM-dependent methyltransferase [Planctomycetota bacterium]
MLTLVRRNKKSKPASKNGTPGKTRAATADRHDLYQKAVQEPEADVRFFNRVYRATYGKRPHFLREDFCGTGHLSCTWVADHSKNIAVGYDLDPDPIEWGKKHCLSQLKPAQQSRVKYIEGNALDNSKNKADIIAALNFSYFCFKEREQLKAYFKAAYKNIAAKGLFILDIEGGPETQQEGQETRFVDDADCTYVWTQGPFDAINNYAVCTIGFRFDDGSEIKRAFRYDWRIWQAPEVTDLLKEVGFKTAHVYWEGTDPDTDEGNGVFTKKDKAENCDAWIAYIVAAK